MTDPLLNRLRVIQERQERAEIDRLLARVAKLEGTLKSIAKQELEEELHPDFHGGDYEAAYEVIIKEARAALSQTPDAENGEKP